MAVIDIPPRMDSPGSDSSGLIACIISDADPGVAMAPVGVSITPNRPRVNRPGNTDSILAAGGAKSDDRGRTTMPAGVLIVAISPCIDSPDGIGSVRATCSISTSICSADSGITRMPFSA